jgi:protein-disulfide isomerase
MAGKSPPSGGSGNKRRGADGSRQSARERSAALQAEQKREERRRTFLVQGGVVVAVVLVVVIATVAVLISRDDDAAGGDAPAGFNAAGGVEVGDADAAVTLTLVEDFACPHCKQFEESNASLFEGYQSGSDVLVEYRPIAFLDRVSTDDYSSRALNAAACVVADDPDSWSSIHRLLFANQPAEGGPGLSDDQLVDLAVEAGADEASVSTCIEDGTYDGWVESTTESTMDEPFFSGTPTVLVDGEKVEDVSADGIEAAVQNALGQ